MKIIEESKAEEFWNWFKCNSQKFRTFNIPERDVLLDEFEEHLHLYNPNIYFEISEEENGINELVITSEGDQNYFDAIELLVGKAPQIRGWKVIAFKPALGFDFIHERGGLEFDPKKIWFLPMTSKQHPKVIGLRVGVKDFREENKEITLIAIWKILDTGIGEKMTAEKIAHVEVCNLPKAPEDEGFIELTDIHNFILWRESKLR
jgi:hypothetical protein